MQSCFSTVAVAKQAKMIGARLKLQRKEDEDDEEQGDEPDDRWGANKRRYYDADTTGLEVRLGDHNKAPHCCMLKLCSELSPFQPPITGAHLYINPLVKTRICVWHPARVLTTRRPSKRRRRRWRGWRRRRRPA